MDNINYIKIYSPFYFSIHIKNKIKNTNYFYKVYFNFFQIQKFFIIERLNLNKFYFFLKFLIFEKKENNLSFDYEKFNEFNILKWIEEIKKYNEKNYFNQYKDNNKNNIFIYREKEKKIKILFNYGIICKKFFQNFFIEDKFTICFKNNNISDEKFNQFENINKFTNFLLNEMKNENNIQKKNNLNESTSTIFKRKNTKSQKDSIKTNFSFTKSDIIEKKHKKHIIKKSITFNIFNKNKKIKKNKEDSINNIKEENNMQVPVLNKLKTLVKEIE